MVQIRSSKYVTMIKKNVEVPFCSTHFVKDDVNTNITADQYDREICFT